MSKLKILDFDTENRPGFYWYDGQTTDMLMCVSWAFLDVEAQPRSLLLRYSKVDGLYMPDLAPFINDLENADIVTGHNIRRHDIPLLNAHRIRTGRPPIAWPHIIDTLDRGLWQGGTKGLSRSQANTADLLGLNQDKMTVHIPVWEQAAAGNPAALQVIRERCESDVVMHMELYRKLVGIV